MTDPEAPESGSEPERREPHHDTLHDLREEIAHEIAEVVEHVPQPVRWTIGKLVRLAMLSLLALIVLAVVSTALYLANRTELVAREVSLVLNQALARHSDVVLVIRDIRGNPASGFRVVSPAVRFRDGNLPPLLEAGSMQIRYSLWGLLSGSRRSIEVYVDHPVIRLSRGRDGRLRIPRWEGKPSKGERTEPVRVHLILSNAEVVMPDTAWSVHRANLDAVAVTAPARVDIANLQWQRGPFSTQLDALTAYAELSDSVRIQIATLRSPELAMSGVASWARSGGSRRVRMAVARVRWPLLARVFDNRTLNVPGEGSGVVEAVGDRAWKGVFDATVDWDSLKGRGDGSFRFANGQLAILPLRFRSQAGTLEGQLDWAHRGWALAGNVTQGDPARWSALHLTGWPSGHLNGWFRFTEETRADGPEVLEASLTASDLAGWRADSALVRVDFPANAPDSFSVRMLRRGGRMVLNGRTDREGWSGDYQLSRYPLDEWEDGRKSGLTGQMLQGAGTVRSRNNGLFVTGDLAGAATDWIGIHAARWRLPGLAGRLLPTPDLETVVRLEDAMYLGVHFDSVAAAIHVGNQRVGLDSVHAAAGDTVVRARGDATFGEQGWSVSLKELRATSSQFDWSATREVALHGDARQVHFDQFEARDGDARLELHGDWAQSGGRYDWHARARGLELSRLGLPREWDLSGRANADLDIQGVSGNPRWSLVTDASGAGMRGHQADSLILELSGAPARLDLGRFEYRLQGGRVLAHGNASDMTRPWPDTLVSDAVVRWIATARHWGGSADAHALSLDRLVALTPRAEGVAGVLEAHASFGGSPHEPTFEASGTLRPAAWKAYRADQIAVRASFSGTDLAVQDLKVSRGGVVSSASGRMPLRLALDRTPVIPEAPMHWTLEAQNGDLAVLAPFIPQIGFASGRFDVRASIDGTPRHPAIVGDAHVRDARVRLAARDELLEGVRADFKIRSSEIVLDSLIAKQGAHGRVSAAGTVHLDGFAMRDYSFRLALRDFAASEAGLYAALLDGDFTVTNGVRVGGQTLPMVVGRARINRAAILFDFSSQSESQQIAAATQPLFWTYRIQVEANDHLNWRPPEGDIEFNADLRMEQTRDSLLIFGEMHALRGNYWYLSNKFAVQNADLTFDNVEGANPLIDATATTRVIPSYPEDFTGTDTTPHEVTVHIKGRANKPVIDFTDAGTPTWDQSAILREITVPRFGGFGNSSLANSLANPLDNYLTRAINRSLSADLSTAFGGYVNEWSLERDQGGLLTGQGDVIVSAGSQITNQLSLRYSQRLPGFTREGSSTTIAPTAAYLFEREVEAEYRLSRFIYLTTDISQRRVSATNTTTQNNLPDYNVNLKARWEY